MGPLQILSIRSRETSRITNYVRNSDWTFTLGRSDICERADEKSTMEIATIYVCVRLLAEIIAGLPVHLYWYTDHIIKKRIL